MVKLPVFEAFCEVIQGEAVVTQAQSTLVRALGARVMRPVSAQGAVILSQRELSTVAEWGEAQTRRPRFNELVRLFHEEVGRVKNQSSPGLQFGQLHVIRHPHAEPREGSAAATRQFVAAQLYPAGGKRAESPALRMRTIARNLLQAAAQDHQATPTIENITQPFVVLGEYFGGKIGAETNRTLQADFRALGTVTVGPLVIAQGFNLEAFAPPAP